MEGRRLIESIRLDRILSFGPNEEAFELEPLNVLIGPNASGKSNLIEALSVLHAAPRDLQVPTREGGGVREWMWKGDVGYWVATIEVELKQFITPIRYRLSFREFRGQFSLQHEELEAEGLLRDPDGLPATLYSYRHSGGQPMISAIPEEGGTLSRTRRQFKLDGVKHNQSILSQMKDSRVYPELTHLNDVFDRISLYSGWDFGRFSPIRLPQNTDLQQDFLLEDASNLALVLNEMMNRPGLKNELLEHMRAFYPFIEDIHTRLIGGTVQVFFHEKGLSQAIPATRLSDGSLQYLCLLAVLCNPYPRWIICIEEPEVGLHPDIIPEVGKLLIKASKRSQIFVTTHSDILVDSLSEVPEAVVVCEKVDGATQLRRLDGESLKPWLEKYRLGELWSSGRFGGNRW